MHFLGIILYLCLDSVLQSCHQNDSASRCITTEGSRLPIILDFNKTSQILITFEPLRKTAKHCCWPCQPYSWAKAQRQIKDQLILNKTLNDQMAHILWWQDIHIYIAATKWGKSQSFECNVRLKLSCIPPVNMGYVPNGSQVKSLWGKRLGVELGLELSSV